MSGAPPAPRAAPGRGFRPRWGGAAAAAAALLAAGAIGCATWRPAEVPRGEARSWGADRARVTLVDATVLTLDRVWIEDGTLYGHAGDRVWIVPVEEIHHVERGGSDDAGLAIVGVCAQFIILRRLFGLPVSGGR
jgi:hypothetical protein